MASYAVKEMFLTLQGEGMQVGRRAVFLRFTGCNLWSGREEDRATATCNFCDTDFVGMDGDRGGRYADADALADQAAALWADMPEPFIVMTGGEPLLQVDDALIAALKARSFEIAVETNGTQPVPDGIDWICVSPKQGSDIILRRGRSRG
jgi:7-carboxy-7-deazaguanine synthase (Cx14CxxC type)